MLFEYVKRGSTPYSKDVVADCQKSVSWVFKPHFPKLFSDPPKLHGSTGYNITI